MAKPKPREPWKIASGHRQRPTGAGPHDPRPNRLRTRSDAERNSLRDQKEN